MGLCVSTSHSVPETCVAVSASHLEEGIVSGYDILFLGEAVLPMGVCPVG